MSPLLTKVRKYETLEAAWRVIQENARTSTSKEVRQEVDKFAQASGFGIRSISRRLALGKFDFKPAKGILSPKRDAAGRKTGKTRPIVLAPLESRIVQRALLNVLVALPALESKISTPFSFGGVRKPIDKTSVDEKRVLSGVPAAIDCVRGAIQSGALYYACADIKSFFTRIPRTYVLEVIGSICEDEEFIKFLEIAVTTELDNMAELREHAATFPIEDIGVAQGNSLSTMLGNITLAKFDLEMNKGTSRCIRYIDDFIILERTSKAANAQLRKATRILNESGMELSPEKSSKGARLIEDGISFLGIEILPGYFRPCSKKQRSLVSSISDEFQKSENAFRKALQGKKITRSDTLVSTLKRVDGMIDAWGKAYFFCNDFDFFRRTDEKISRRTRTFLGVYKEVRLKIDEQKRDNLLGICKLSEQNRVPFIYPSNRRKSTTPAASP